MKQVRFFLIISLLLISNSLIAKKINGIVSSANLNPIEGVIVSIKGSNIDTKTNAKGFYKIKADKSQYLIFSHKEYISQEILVDSHSQINIFLIKKNSIDLEDDILVEELMDEELEIIPEQKIKSNIRHFRNKRMTLSATHLKSASYNLCGNTGFTNPPVHNTEEYSTIHENGFNKTIISPVSTVSVDVDAASYSNMRRFIKEASMPPKDAVRIEEMINYFDYDYKNPKGNIPFSINKELSICPWNKDNYILQIGLQGKKIKTEDIPASNLVFLIDVSGSMSQSNKLPLLKKAFKLLVNKLRPQDRVAIVVYAGNSGLVLESTPGSKKGTIINALEKLNAGGSTAGGEGIKLAYKVAHDNFISKGNNRIILATDGDFNIGASSNAAMERLIEKERNNGVFISVLGLGMGNYKDSKMEIIADKGNGNYAYIDNILEAKKVLIDEFGSTLFTIAKDVKVQIEFNPSQVAQYRLIGYENRKLNTEDFADDKKDAGEIGAGHNVTFLYEIVPFKGNTKAVDNLKYQNNTIDNTGKKKNELATVKFRYKKPTENTSLLIEKIIPLRINKNMSDNLKFASSVAAFGMILRDSKYKAKCNYKMVLKLAKEAKGKDENGYRSEFIQLVSLSKELQIKPEPIQNQKTNE